MATAKARGSGAPDDKAEMKRAMLERLAAKKKANGTAAESVDDSALDDDPATRRVQSMKTQVQQASFRQLFSERVFPSTQSSLLNVRGGARSSLNPASLSAGRGTAMTPEEREAMVAKLKASKRATVGTPAANLGRSKSANTLGVNGPVDKRAALKKRLESFNKLQEEGGAAAAAAAAATTSAEPEADETDEPAVVDKSKVLKKSQTEQVLPLSKRADALLDGDSSGDEKAAAGKAAKEEPLAVGERLDALYLEDGLWYAAKVEEVHEDGSCTVVFTEYGNTQVCQPEEVRRRKKKGDDKDKATRLEKIKSRQKSAKDELAKTVAVDPEDAPDEKRWRGQSAIGVAPPEITVGKSKRDREKAHRGTFSQMGNDSLATPDAGLFADDVPVVNDARRKAKAQEQPAAEDPPSEGEPEPEPEEEEEEEEKDSPTFLAKLFGGGSSKKEKEKEKSKEPEKSPPPKEKGFFAKMFGSSSDEEKEKKPVRSPAKTEAPAKDKGGGFFDDLFKKGDKEDSEDEDDEDVSAFFGKKK